jgi:hypothetical protein
MLPSIPIAIDVSISFDLEQHPKGPNSVERNDGSFVRTIH